MRIAALLLGTLTSVSTLVACTSDHKPPNGDTFVPDSPAVYVAKVKNILVGLPPTDEEVQAVVKDPNALGGLVDSWMSTPEYQQKMMVFFELAFQQTQITTADFIDLIPSNGLGVGRAVPQLLQNVRESFARTVLDLAARGRPLTDAFSTTELMMTPALMELYAYLDARRVDDNGNIIDAFAKANPTLMITLETAQGPIPIDQTLNPASPNYMHWYTPDLPTLINFPDPSCNKLDPITFKASSAALHDLLHGAIPTHLSPTNVSCNQRTGTVPSIQFAPADYTTWKLVKIRKPTGAEPTSAFYDLKTLHAANQLVLGTPHPGFFSTPAFFANWPTNKSNQMRVTLNQALIVTTGTAIDGTDGTTPPSTPGLDAQHAQPGTACFSCHQLLDPTRSILSSTYSWFYYPQTDAKLMGQPGLFAFQGVVQPMRTIDDFTSLLASHPLVPQAWAQKLCYYMNSAACDASDPEFQRIVGDFQSSGMQWTKLVHELATSPITTNAAATVTATTNGEVIAVSRRDHLCAALDNRLGFYDLCQLDTSVLYRAPSTIAQLVSGMPSDGYGRGATAPILPNQPSMFYRAAIENVCVAVASLVIDAKADPMQPNAKKWSSAQPDAAIAEFVSLVMALTPSDSRSAPVLGVLTDHFHQAKASGASATDALRSTFVAACLSPSFVGIGL